MYKDDQTHRNFAERNSDDIFSKPVRAGKRTYFFDVKSTKDRSDYFLTITESTRPKLTAATPSTSTRYFYTRRTSKNFRKGSRMSLNT